MRCFFILLSFWTSGWFIKTETSVIFLLGLVCADLGFMNRV